MGAVVQWRKFNFFDVKNEFDDGKLSALLKDVKITCSTSGRGLIYFGDADGFVYSFNRQFQVSTFRAHETSIHTIICISSSNLLITLQDGSQHGPSEIKVWAPDRLPSQSSEPVCLRVIKPDPRPSAKGSQVECPRVTAVSLHPNNALLAVGCSDGSIILYRGDVRRERGSKSRVIVTLPGGAVTSLHTRHSVGACHVFATTEHKTFCINCSVKDKETTVELDDSGCEANCSCLADNKHEHEFLVARKDAIYAYTTDSRASCYVFQGKKSALSWFKGHLIVISEQDQQAAPGASFSENGSSVLTVYDPVNKLVSLSVDLDGFLAVEGEWGGLYVVVAGPRMLHLAEKDLPGKLDILFKKNQFDIAINLAKWQCCGEEEMSEIVRQHADWLFRKGSPQAAAEQYIKTIPHLEPSYVIKKFLDMEHIEHLTTYLQALHKSGHATLDHTTLMLNCFTRLKDTDRLDQFIKDGDTSCDVSLAISVCRRSGFVDHAMALASKHRLHHHFLDMLLEDKRDHQAALKYISSLNLETAKEFVMVHGSVLLNHLPEAATKLLVSLCTNFKGTKWSSSDENSSCLLASPEDFDHLFIGQNDSAVDFLVKVGEVRPLSKRLNTALITELLHQHSTAPEGQDQDIIEEKILSMLQQTRDSVEVDQDTALLLCDKHKFQSGKMLLWERAGMFEELMSWHASQGDFESVVSVCRKHGAGANAGLWRKALQILTDEGGAFPPDTALLNDVLREIDENELIPALEVVDLITSSPHISLGQVREYLLKVVDRQADTLAMEASSSEERHKEADGLRESIRAINNDTVEFTGTKCDICNNSLDLPTVHFLCRHSFHVHCFQSYSEFESECPVCYPEAKKLTDLLCNQERYASRTDLLQGELERAADSFCVLADFVGRGVFTSLQRLGHLNPSPMTTIDRESIDPFSLRGNRSGGPRGPETSSEARVRAAEVRAGPLGTGSEARLRMSEGSSSLLPEKPSVGRLRQSDRRTDPINSNITEARMRSGYAVSSSSSPSSYRRAQDSAVDSISSAVISASGRPRGKQPVSENPFDDSAETAYPEDKNPFGDFETELDAEKSNPFAEDYDETKNPFAEDEDPQKSIIVSATLTSARQVKSENPFEDDYDPKLNPFED